MKKTLGILGGMGPAATVYFMDLVVGMTLANTDQDHLNILVRSIPSIPDRTSYILDPQSESPLPAMVKNSRSLAASGADLVAIPCITAHYFYDSLQDAIPIPIINAVEETVSYLRNHGVKRVGIMATSGTVHAGIFQTALQEQGLEPVLPTAQAQQDIMDLIYLDIKTGRPADMVKFRLAEAELRGNGAEIIILGCTELSIIKRDSRIGPGFIDVLDVLAKSAIERCGARVREEYGDLITK